MKSIRQSGNPIFHCHNFNGTKLILKLRLGFNCLSDHKFRHDFQDNYNQNFSSSENIETTTHYLLHCPNCLDQRITLLNSFQNIEKDIPDKNDSRLTEMLISGDFI